MFAGYDEDACNDMPDIMYHLDMRLIRKAWSMVSNAADRSSRMRAVGFPLSIFSVISLRTFQRVVSVE